MYPDSSFFRKSAPFLFVVGLCAGLLVSGLDKPEPLPEAAPPLAAKTDLGHETDRRLAIIGYQLQARQRILGHLIAGRWTLDDAAKCIHILDEVHPLFDQKAPVISDCRDSADDGYPQKILQWVENSDQLPAGARGVEVRRRLECELATIRDTGRRTPDRAPDRRMPHRGHSGPIGDISKNVPLNCSPMVRGRWRAPHIASLITSLTSSAQRDNA
jgi:hypothetical protein